jgi:hypothetical protein
MVSLVGASGGHQRDHMMKTKPKKRTPKVIISSKELNYERIIKNYVKIL